MVDWQDAWGTHMKIAGIDPGKNGQLTILDTLSDQAWFYKLQFDKQNHLDLLWFKTVQKFLNSGDMIMVEKISNVGGLPGGSTSTFNFGNVYGQINIASRMSGCMFRQIGPQTWQKTIHEGITGKLSAKEKSKMAYEQLFPSDPFKRPRGGKVSHDLIDSLLIATFGALKYGGTRIRDWKFEEIIHGVS